MNLSACLFPLEPLLTATTFSPRHLIYRHASAQTPRYTCPLVCGYAWMPDRKGMVSGFVLAGFGASAAVLDLVAMMVANPGNASPDPTTGYYGKVMKHDAVRLMYHVLALLVCKARAWWSWQRMPELSTAQY